MSYSVKPCKSEETLKGYWGQLVGVRAARMQINCRLSLLLLCVYVCLCVCVCIATHTHIYIRKRSLFVLWHIFFLAAVFIHPTANHLSFFILLTWILFLFRNREKKKLNICVSFQYATHLCVLWRVFQVQFATHGRNSSSC